MEYKKQLVKFDIGKINNFALLLFILPFAAMAAINLLAFKRPLLLTSAFYWDILIAIAIFICGLVCHEGLHALGGILFGKVKPQDIKFGILPKQFMLYCHIKTPLKVSAYQALLLLPVIVTGIIPLLISAFFGNIFLVVVFAALVSGGAGDIIMFKSLCKLNKDQLIIDHEDAPAYYLVYPSDNLPEDFVEVTEEQEKELKEAMQNTPKGKTSGRSNLMKVLSVLLFLAFTVFAVFFIALLMKLF